MKVKELLVELKKANQDAEVILQKDSEGNDYSPLKGADLNVVYIANSEWSGNVYSMDWTADDACKTSAEFADIKAKPRCVVLYPIN
jgi:hypothetical protein